MNKQKNKIDRLRRKIIILSAKANSSIARGKHAYALVDFGELMGYLTALSFMMEGCVESDSIVFCQKTQRQTRKIIEDLYSRLIDYLEKEASK